MGGKMGFSENKLCSALVLITFISFLLLFISSAAADAEGKDAVSWVFRRSLLEGNNAENLNSTSLVLAKERTLRKDPLDDLNYYTGGWNISNDHYIASVLYTGSTLFLVAAIWFVGFGLFLLLVSMYVCCCRRHRYGYSGFAYCLSLILLSLFTISAIGLILIVVAAVMLALALLGFLLSISGLQFLVYILVFIGWILVAITFILCGVFLVLHNMMSDTCVAMNDWVMNPTAHTALDKVIPCVDVDTAQETLSQSKDVTFQVVRLVNGIITNVTNAQNLPPPSVAPLISYNQSGPFVPLLCNPYNIDKTNRTCAAGEADLSNVTQIWRNYVCQVSKNNICTTVGRLTPTLYNQMSSAVNVSYGLYHYGPFLTNLVDCTFVRDTFSVIHDDHCPDLERYSRFVYIGLAMVSAAVMLSLILWVLYARERRHRKYTKLVDATSDPNSLESKGP
ncbi:uncharacterized protein LOC142541001 isoform X3 [Primulina tabacum]|uniref:uncharacterized protein LOC142541001 isoform X3 n=1 Tax=Primulina tabacum TaxID=48773 RepID=UPI003F5A7B56